MDTINSNGTDRIVGMLRTALTEAESEYKAWENEVTQARALWQQRLDGIRQAVQGLDITFAKSDDESELTNLSISDDKLDLVRQFMRKHDAIRQADIARALKLNSGTVSVALRKLQATGEVRPTEKEQGSRIWQHTSVGAVVSRAA